MLFTGLIVVVPTVYPPGESFGCISQDHTASNGNQKFFTAFSNAIPIAMERNTIPIMPIQKSHAHSHEFTHSKIFIAYLGDYFPELLCWQ